VDDEPNIDSAKLHVIRSNTSGAFSAQMPGNNDEVLMRYLRSDFVRPMCWIEERTDCFLGLARRRYLTSKVRGRSLRLLHSKRLRSERLRSSKPLRGYSGWAGYRALDTKAASYSWKSA
jgi:hypothetical protein